MLSHTMLADAELKFWSTYGNSVLLHLDLPFGGKIDHTIKKIILEWQLCKLLP